MIKERLNQLRKLMAEKEIDAYLIPSGDYHGSEYVGEYFRLRAYMSGFKGSAGTLLVTDGWAGLWTDGRYFIQAAKELAGSGIELMKSGQPEVPTPSRQPYPSRRLGRPGGGTRSFGKPAEHA